jgi:hypothetical protein
MSSALGLSKEAVDYLLQNPFSYPQQKLPKNTNLLTTVQLPPKGTNLLNEACFGREDESSDFQFYSEPRFVTHIDDKAIAGLTKFYEKHFPPTPQGNNIAHLDLCSSWVSFFPANYSPKLCVGLGMSEPELARNEKLTSTVVQDLNTNPSLLFPVSADLSYVLSIFSRLCT